jgi:Flp pilus assembly protein CpaB
MLKCSSSVMLFLASAVSLVGPQAPIGVPDARLAEAQPMRTASLDYGPAIPPGRIRFAIRIYQLGFAGGWPQPYDEVNVIHMVRVGNAEVSHQVLLRKILLLGWIRDTPDRGLVDVAVTPCQASQLLWAMSVGELRLFIRKYGQEEP